MSEVPLTTADHIQTKKVKIKPLEHWLLFNLYLLSSKIVVKTIPNITGNFGKFLYKFVSTT